MYEQIARNKRDSWVLVIAVAALLASLGYAIARAEEFPVEIGVGFAVVVAMVASVSAYYGGSAMVLGVSHAQPIEKADNPRLYNVVEEMAIASGLPAPKVYIIDDSAPNAFATGRSPESASIAITTGLLDKLDRDELQGVIAHEMAHIKNYDTRLLLMLAVLVGGIVLLADMYWRMNRFGGRRRRGSDSGQAQIIFLVIALLLAVLAPIFAKMLEMAVSRRREYLADASAALLTRYPDGLASALEKIARDPEPLEVSNRATQHLYIVNPVKALSDRGSSLFSTHPDINDRIQRLHQMGLIRGQGPEAGGQAPGGRAPGDQAPGDQAPGGQAPGDQAPGGQAFGGGGRSIVSDAGAGFARMGGRSALVETPATAAPPVFGTPFVSSSRTMAPAASVQVSATPPRRVAPWKPVCPRCQAELLDGNIQGKRASGCRQCGGVWLGEADVEVLLREAPDGLDAADRRFPNLIGHGWDLITERTCPICAAALEPHMTETPARVPLDRCPNGHGLWFDDGELSALAWAAKRRGGE